MTINLHANYNATLPAIITSSTLATVATDVYYVIYYHGLMAVFAAFALVANGVVVAAVMVTPALHTVTNYYIVALAVVEALASIFYALYTLGTLMISEATIRHFISELSLIP